MLAQTLAPLLFALAPAQDPKLPEAGPPPLQDPPARVLRARVVQVPDGADSLFRMQLRGGGARTNHPMKAEGRSRVTLPGGVDYEGYLYLIGCKEPILGPFEIPREGGHLDWEVGDLVKTCELTVRNSRKLMVDGFQVEPNPSHEDLPNIERDGLRTWVIPKAGLKVKVSMPGYEPIEVSLKEGKQSVTLPPSAIVEFSVSAEHLAEDKHGTLRASMEPAPGDWDSYPLQAWLGTDQHLDPEITKEKPKFKWGAYDGSFGYGDTRTVSKPRQLRMRLARAGTYSVTLYTSGFEDQRHVGQRIVAKTKVVVLDEHLGAEPLQVTLP